MNNSKWNARYARIYSRHPSHSILRKNNNGILLPKLAAVRFGSSTPWTKTPYELNTVEAIANSSSKLKMKTCFTEAGVKTAEWWRNPLEIDKLDEIPFPLIAKKIFGSRGQGMVKINNQEEFTSFVTNNNKLSNYIFERYYNYSREYRLHLDAQGCFYTCRKMLKSDTPDDKRWYRNDSNSVWYVEENEKFDKPVNWDSIVAEGVKALNAVGLDFGAIDLRIQSATNSKGKKRENPEFIIVEINSAPSFGDITAQKYIDRLPITFAKKYNL